MIGRISGVLLENTVSHVLIDVSGVGYEIEVPAPTAYALPEPDQQVVLHIHFVVREDAQLLYGFIEKRDRDLFRLMLRVNGVGAKVALAMLSTMDADTLVKSLVDGNKAALTSVSGVGPRLAERVLVEAPSLLKSWIPGAPSAQTSTGITAPFGQDAIGALVALGYKRNKAEAAVSAVDEVADSVEDLLRKALKGLS